MDTKKWFSCKAHQSRDVVVYVEAADIDEARHLFVQGEWDEIDWPDDEREGVSAFDIDGVVEVDLDEVEFSDEDDDEDDDE